VGAAADGHVKPRPQRRAPSLSSFTNEASNIRCGVIHFSPPRVVRFLSVLRSISVPVPGTGSRLTTGFVVPAPWMLLLMVRG